MRLDTDYCWGEGRKISLKAWHSGKSETHVIESTVGVLSEEIRSDFRQHLQMRQIAQHINPVIPMIERTSSSRICSLSSRVLLTLILPCIMLPITPPEHVSSESESLYSILDVRPEMSLYFSSAVSPAFLTYSEAEGVCSIRTSGETRMRRICDG